MREWIAESDVAREHPVFLIRISREGTVHGWQRADFPGVLDAVGDQLYASFIDELPDDLAVWALTDAGLKAVRLKFKRHDHIGNLEVIASWHDPKDPGKARCREVGFLPIYGA